MVKPPTPEQPPSMSYPDLITHEANSVSYNFHTLHRTPFLSSLPPNSLLLSSPLSPPSSPLLSSPRITPFPSPALVLLGVLFPTLSLQHHGKRVHLTDDLSSLTLLFSLFTVRRGFCVTCIVPSSIKQKISAQSSK